MPHILQSVSRNGNRNIEKREMKPTKKNLKRNETLLTNGIQTQMHDKIPLDFRLCVCVSARFFITLLNTIKGGDSIVKP